MYIHLSFSMSFLLRVTKFTKKLHKPFLSKGKQPKIFDKHYFLLKAIFCEFEKGTLLSSYSQKILISYWLNCSIAYSTYLMFDGERSAVICFLFLFLLLSTCTQHNAKVIASLKYFSLKESAKVVYKNYTFSSSEMHLTFPQSGLQC